MQKNTGNCMANNASEESLKILSDIFNISKLFIPYVFKFWIIKKRWMGNRKFCRLMNTKIHEYK